VFFFSCDARWVLTSLFSCTECLCLCCQIERRRKKPDMKTILFPSDHRRDHDTCRYRT
jgi:hypothetical protein